MCHSFRFIIASLLSLALLASIAVAKDRDVLNANNASTIRCEGGDGKPSRLLSITDGKLCFHTIDWKADKASSAGAGRSQGAGVFFRVRS